MAIAIAALTSLDSPAVRELVERLNASSREYSHLYRPLSAEAVDAFEQKYGITLPADYRYVITQLGNGVGHFLYPLGMEQMSGEDFTREYDVIGLVADISQLFPLTEAWNLPEELLRDPVIPRDATPDEEHRLNEESLNELEAAYVENAHLLNGAIPISDLGCGQVIWLVVNGPQKGYVWDDDTVDGRGIFPICDERGRPMTFTDWFLNECRNHAQSPCLDTSGKSVWAPAGLSPLDWPKVVAFSPILLVAGLVFACFHPRTAAEWLQRRLADFQAWIMHTDGTKN
jgi:hypothetical protein